MESFKNDLLIPFGDDAYRRFGSLDRGPNCNRILQFSIRDTRERPWEWTEQKSVDIELLKIVCVKFCKSKSADPVWARRFLRFDWMLLIDSMHIRHGKPSHEKYRSY